MIRIIDSSLSCDIGAFGTPEHLIVDRRIYRVLQRAVYIPIEKDGEDISGTLGYFFEEMQKISDGIEVDISSTSLDNFFGSLGVTQYYPHKDNTYKGELNG